MKKSLQSVQWLVILLSTTTLSYSQTIILSEDFSGFSVGTHSQPYNYDVSSSLDTLTSAPGWKGTLIYSAGGEVKIGKSTATGWLETPSLDLSANDGSCKISFDVARWPNDASTVQVYIDGNTVGSVITPPDNFTTTEIDITSGTSSSRIRIQGLTKRFFIDNLVITTGLPTESSEIQTVAETIRLWPVPADNELFIEGAGSFAELKIVDLSGTIFKSVKTEGINKISVDVTGFKPGFYLLIFRTDHHHKIVKFIKN